MRKAYMSVLESYWLRMKSSIVIPALTIGQLLLLGLLLTLTRRMDAVILLVLLLAICAFSFMLWGHFREQIINERRRLMPGFAGPHITIFAMLSILAVVVLPFLAAEMLHGISVLAIVGACVALFAFFGWWVVTLSGILVVAFMLGYILLLNGIGGRLIESYFTGQNPDAAWALLIGGVIATIGAIVRALTVTEESVIYRRKLQTNTWNLRPRMTGDITQEWAQVTSQFSLWPRKRGNVRISVGNGWWSRVQRWRNARPSPLPMMVMMAVMLIFMGRFAISGNQGADPTSMVNPMWAIWLIMMPAGMVMQVWLRQWRFLEREFLRPIERRAFLKEIGAAIAIDVVQAWGVFAIGLVGLAVWTGIGKFRIGVLASLLGFSFLVQVFAFAVEVLAMRHRSLSALAVAGLVAAIPAIPMVGVTIPGLQEYQCWSIGAAVLFALVGVLVIRKAYDRWLVTELG